MRFSVWYRYWIYRIVSMLLMPCLAALVYVWPRFGAWCFVKSNYVFLKLGFPYLSLSDTPLDRRSLRWQDFRLPRGV